MPGLFLPPGASEMPEDLQRKLQFGSPEHGWLGDENMFLTKCDGRKCGPRPCAGKGWLVARSERSGLTKYFMHHPAPGITGNFLRQLAKGDPRTVDVNKTLAEVDAHNEKLVAEKEEQTQQRFQEGAERLYHNLKDR